MREVERRGDRFQLRSDEEPVYLAVEAPSRWSRWTDAERFFGLDL